MGNCRDCKHWEKRPQISITAGDAGRERHVCGVIDDCYPWDLPADGCAGIWADATDDTGLHSDLITGPDFGCVKFELRKGLPERHTMVIEGQDDLITATVDGRVLYQNWPGQTTMPCVPIVMPIGHSVDLYISLHATLRPDRP